MARTLLAVASRFTPYATGILCLMAVAPMPVDAQTVTGQDRLSFSRPSAAAKAPDQKARKMVIGFHVNSIDEIDWKNSTFRSDLYWWIRYPEPATEVEQARIEALEFVNGDVENGPGKVQEKKRLVATNEIYISYRTIARFHFEPDFRKYPFDRQRFPIIVEHETLPAADLVFQDDADSYGRSGVSEALWGLGSSVRVPDLEVTRVVREFSNHEYKTNFGDPQANSATGFSRVELGIEVKRRFVPYLVKILIPLFIILLLTYLVFFVPAQELEVAAGLTVTSILACIAFQFTLTTNMPDVGYLMTSDRIFHLSYLLIMLAMAETVWTFNLEKSGEIKLSKRIEAWSRIVYPAGFILGMLVIVAEGLSG